MTENDQQKSLIFSACVGLIILAIIVGSIYYLVKFIQGRVEETQALPITGPVTAIATKCEPYRDTTVKNIPAGCLKYFSEHE